MLTTKTGKSAKRMMGVFLLMCLLCIFPMITGINQSVVYAATAYYVSPAGSDTNPGTLAQPFKTLQHAASIMTAGDICYIRAGVYRETVAPANSGTSASPIKFVPYNGESVTVSGGDLITGWTQYSGSIYKATMNWDIKNGAGNIVFVDGALGCEARWPNSTDLLDSASYAAVDSATADPSTEYTITDSALSSFSNGYWNGATAVCVSGVGYQAFTSQITSFNSNTLHFAPWTEVASWYNPKSGNFYYITHSLNALDIQNEWYKDSANSTLYLWAPGGDTPNNHTVEAKKRDYAFDLSNKSYIEVNGINIRSASIKTTGANYCKLTGADIQGVEQDMAVGKRIIEAIKLEGTHNEIRNCEIHNMFGAGLLVYGDSNSVVNNYIHNIDLSITGLAGITLDGKNHLISNNTVARAARSLLTSSYTGSFRGCDIQYNNFYDACMLTDDAGVVYLVNSDYGNTEFHHNWVHDNHAATIASGVYADSSTSNFIAYRNVIWNCTLSGIKFNSPSNFNLIYNNSTCNNASLSSYDGTGWGDDSYGVKIFNNILNDGVTMGSDAAIANNISSGDPRYVNSANSDFHIQSASPAIDAGMAISGVTDGYTGAASDCGAYEYGGTDWTPGHNFTNPPNPVYGLHSIPYKNRVENSGFEFGGSVINQIIYGGFESWTTAAGSPQVVNCNTWDYETSSMAKMNFSSARLNSGDRIEQTITGLSPNTKYELSGWGKIDGMYVQAESYGSGSGSGHWDFTDGQPSVYRGGEYIGPMQNGDYLCYNNINFNNLYNRIAIAINKSTSGGTVEVRLDSTTGTLLGTISLPDNFGAWLFQTGTISSVSGTHNLYLVFKGTGDMCIVDSFKLYNSSMGDSMKIGVKNYSGGAGDTYITANSASWVNNTLRFTTGASDTSATIYADKPAGSYSGYVDDLGLVEYNIPVGATFYDGFEDGLGNWTTILGTPGTSTAKKHWGSNSFIVNQDTDVIKHDMGSNTNKVAVVWYYDDTSDNTVETITMVDDGTHTIGLGVDTSVSASKYIYRIGTTYTTTAIDRSTGWHQLTFDYRSGTDVKLYVDGIQVANSNTCTAFHYITLGDCWSGGITGLGFFDDISVQDSLPFAAPAFSDGFENGLGNWTAILGTPGTSTAQKHSGSNSFIVDQDTDVIKYNMGSNTNKVAVVWYYDDTSDDTVETIAMIDDGTHTTGLGVDTSVSASKYIYRIGTTYTATAIDRSTGWHQLTFDYRSGTDVKLYVDGTQVAASTASTSFHYITLGDCWPGGITGVGYFDDVSVQDVLPFIPPVFSDGFENGLGNWTTVLGTPGTSTVQAHSGSNSFIVNADADAIKHDMGSNTNKVVILWYYDDASDSTAETITMVDDGTNTMGLGVDTSVSATKYIYRIGAAYTATAINRSTGWHQLTFDYRSGTDVKLYVDGTQVATSAACTSFRYILMGDLWASGITGTGYFDDICVQNSMP